jgi:putative sigma-54 modulation protein
VNASGEASASVPGVAGSGPEGAPEVIRSQPVPAKPMSVEEAVMQMDLTNNEFFVFRNAQSESLSVIYRRKDGNYGLIESEAR